MNHRQSVGLSRRAMGARAFARVCVLACIVPMIANAQDSMRRESPQSAVQSFLAICKAGDYNRAARYLNLRSLTQEDRRKSGPDLAQALAGVLERDNDFDAAALSAAPEGDPNSGLPQNRQRVDSFTVNGQTYELQMERVTFRSGNSVWLFTPESVQLIPQLEKLTSDSPIEKWLPSPLVSWKFAGTALWRWIALVLLAFGLVAFSRLLSRAVLYLAEPVLKRFAPRMPLTDLHRLVGPLRLLVSVALFRAGVAWLAPSEQVQRYTDRGLAALFLLGLAWVAAAAVDVIMGRLYTRLESKHRALYSVLPLTGRVLKLGILLVTVVVVLTEWGYHATTLLAGLGVGGVAIALAAQKTLENFFGSVSVISDRPVAVGDFCKFGDRAGTVEDIGIRSTRIRTADRTLVTVPNGQFSTMVLENFSRRDKMLFHFVLNLRRDTTPEQVRTVLTSISEFLTADRNIEAGALPVRFVGVGTYSLDLEISVYILTLDGDEFMRTQQTLLLRIMDTLESAGTALALPTQASINYAPLDASPDSGSAQRAWPNGTNSVPQNGGPSRTPSA